MDEAIVAFKLKIQQKLELHDQYNKVIRQTIELYNMDMASFIKNDFCKTLDSNSFIKICEICEKEAIKLFNEEKVKISNENIDEYFLSKLKGEINLIRDKFRAIYNHFIDYEFNKKQNFGITKYYSKTQIEEFHEKERMRIMDSMQKFSIGEISKKLEDQNDFINEKEKEFAEKAIGLSFKTYCDCFEEKLKTSFYKPKDIDDIHDKLLEFTIKSMIESCHFNEYQNHLAEICEKGLRLRVENIYEKKCGEYERLVGNVIQFLSDSRKDSIQYFCNEMKAKLSLKPYLKSNEFSELHHHCSKRAMEKFIESTEILKKDFDPEFMNKILLESQSLIRKSISSEKDKFRYKNERNTPFITSLAIFLGKNYLIAATYRNGVEIILDKFGQKLRPNSILFMNEILIGTEAQKHYSNFYSDMKSFQNFDIKKLFGKERNSISNEDLNAYPFSFSEDKMFVHIDYRDLKIELSVEALLALMTLDMKSDAEKKKWEAI